jgi:hypothetical protein
MERFHIYRNEKTTRRIVGHEKTRAKAEELVNELGRVNPSPYGYDIIDQAEGGGIMTDLPEDIESRLKLKHQAVSVIDSITEFMQTDLVVPGQMANGHDLNVIYAAGLGLLGAIAALEAWQQSLSQPVPEVSFSSSLREHLKDFLCGVEVLSSRYPVVVDLGGEGWEIG